MTATITRKVVDAPKQVPNRAERLVAAVRKMSREDVVERIRTAREMTNEQVAERQEAERRSRAAAAVARINAR